MIMESIHCNEDIDVLMVTANVGSLFEDVCILFFIFF